MRNLLGTFGEENTLTSKGVDCTRKRQQASEALDSARAKAGTVLNFIPAVSYFSTITFVVISFLLSLRKWPYSHFLRDPTPHESRRAAGRRPSSFCRLPTIRVFWWKVSSIGVRSVRLSVLLLTHPPSSGRNHFLRPTTRPETRGGRISIGATRETSQFSLNIPPAPPRSCGQTEKD